MDNTVGGFLHGLPSSFFMSRTGTSVSSGAKSRWAVLISGIVVALVVLAFAPLVELIPMPALAGLLIYAGVAAFNLEGLSRGWQVQTTGQLAMALTFILTSIIPIQAALFAGIVSSLLMYIYETSLDASVTEGSRRIMAMPFTWLS